MSSGPTTIQLPTEVAEAISARIRGSGFTSVDAFVAFVLARLLESPASDQPFSEEDERRIKERLRSLGYID